MSWPVTLCRNQGADLGPAGHVEYRFVPGLPACSK
jgi:hypothetical protein